ncbi:MAG: hypothetical protein U0031_17160 [Thermomicrobiales bacterium]
MDSLRFDALARALIGPRTRRGFLGTLLGGSLSTPLFGAAGKKGTRKRKNKDKSGTPPRRKPPCAQALEPGRRATIRPVPNNQVGGCDAIKDLRLGGIWYENGKTNWTLERYPQHNVGGVTIGRFVFKTRGETGLGRADRVPAGFDPSRPVDPKQPGESGVCVRVGAALRPVPANRVCAQVTVEFATDVEQRVFRPDWNYGTQGVSEDCMTMARDYFTMVDEHEALHLQDNEAIQEWYAREWKQRTCYACVARDGLDDDLALAAATAALNTDLDRVIAAVSAEIERDSTLCGNARDKLEAKDPDCSRCGCGDGLRRAAVACGQACCGVCEECADPETSTCAPKVCEACEECRDGQCVAVDCGDPCLKCSNTTCQPDPTCCMASDGSVTRCEDGQSCCGGRCVPTRAGACGCCYDFAPVCCPNGGCCSLNYPTCCNRVCCKEGTVCCTSPNYDWCCPAGNVCGTTVFTCVDI